MVMIELENIFLRPSAPDASVSNIKLLVTCCFPETVCIQVTALHNDNRFESIRILLKNPINPHFVKKSKKIQKIQKKSKIQCVCGNAAFCICSLICQELQQYTRDAAC